MTSVRSTKVLAMVLAGLVMVGVVAACGDDPPPTLDYLTDARLSTANANTALIPTFRSPRSIPPM